MCPAGLAAVSSCVCGGGDSGAGEDAHVRTVIPRVHGYH